MIFFKNIFLTLSFFLMLPEELSLLTRTIRKYDYKNCDLNTYKLGLVNSDKTWDLESILC